MDNAERQFLQDLLHAPGPSGYERPIQDVVREYGRTFAADVQTDWHGNVVLAVNPHGSPRIMLDGHCDQIGLLVQHIDDQGYLRVSPIGGWDVQMLIGQRMQIWTKSGPVQGVIARKAIHLLTADERKKVPELQELWIDIGANSEADARSVVSIGDPVTLNLGYAELRNGLAFAPGMDDRVGVWVIVNAARRAALKHPRAALFAVSSVQEEIGLRGATTSAFRLEPDLGIAVDVTHATDCPTIDQNQYGRVKVGAGPVLFRGPNVNPVVFQQLSAIAAREEIPVQVNGLSRAASNDGNAMQISRGGVATGIVGIPNRYMHSPVEVISLHDIDRAASLIASFCTDVTPDSDFTP